MDGLRFQTADVGAIVVGLAVAVIFATAGCDPSDGGGDADTGDQTADATADVADDTADGGAEISFDVGDGTSAIEDLSAVANPKNVLSYYIDWTSVEPVVTELTVRCGADWRQSYSGESERTDHRVFVMGLWPGATCKVTATADGATESILLEVGSSPEFLPALDVETSKPAKMQSGWTFFNLANPFDDIPTVIAAVDARGRYRWYRQLPTSDTAPDPDIEFLDETILVGGNRRRSGPHELDWEGEVVWNGEGVRSHHDIHPDEDGQVIHHLRHDYDCESGYVQDEFVTYSRQKGENLYAYSICDHWTPPDGAMRDDWTHFNAIEPVPDEEAWIISSRHTSTLYKLDPTDDAIVWKMGKYGDFGLTDDERFYLQHAPEIQANGNILLFDNGAEARQYSRAVEIAYDTDSMEAQVVWEYAPEPQIFAHIWGDADRLDNGNTLATFGLRNENPDRNSHLIEVTADKEKVWHVSAPNKWGWYRSDRLVDPPTGHVK